MPGERAHHHGGTSPAIPIGRAFGCSIARLTRTRAGRRGFPISRYPERRTFEAGHIPGANFLDLQASSRFNTELAS